MEKAISNRKNSRKSTGPRTTRGKKNSSQNARKHNLTSNTIVTPHECINDFYAFSHEIINSFDPAPGIEMVLADRIVICLWRLRRFVHAETMEFTNLMTAGGRNVASSFMWMENHDQWISKIAKYESHLDRSLYRALHELQRLMAARRGQKSDVPLAIDIFTQGLNEDFDGK